MNATQEAFSGDLVNECTETAAASRMKGRRAKGGERRAEGIDRNKEKGERGKGSVGC